MEKNVFNKLQASTMKMEKVVYLLPKKKIITNTHTHTHIYMRRNINNTSSCLRQHKEEGKSLEEIIRKGGRFRRERRREEKKSKAIMVVS